MCVFRNKPGIVWIALSRISHPSLECSRQRGQPAPASSPEAHSQVCCVAAQD